MKPAVPPEVGSERVASWPIDIHRHDRVRCHVCGSRSGGCHARCRDCWGGYNEGCAQVLRFVSFPFVGVVGVGRSRVARVVVIVALVVVTVGGVSDA